MVVDSAQTAVDRANGYTSYAVGMCLQWVRGPCWGLASYFGSAIEAWNGAKHKHPGDRNPPLGAPLFYRGGNYGHIVIARPNDMRSTDCPTSTRVSAAAIDWVERTWGYSYLGWTEDLNGVTLPLSTTTAPDEDDEMPNYDHASRKTEIPLTAGEWQSVPWESVAAGDAFTEGDHGIRLRGARYNAVFTGTFTAPEGSVIRMRTVEVDDGKIVETNPQSEHLATSGQTDIQHSWIGKAGEGRRVRLQVKCPQGGTLDAAQAAILSW